MEIKLADGEAIDVSTGGVSLGKLDSDGLTGVKKLSVADGGKTVSITPTTVYTKQGSAAAKSIDWPANQGTLALTAGPNHAGNLAALDAQGNPTDAGWTAGDLARYALVAKSISNNAVALDDRACNYVDAHSLGSSDSLDVDFPILVDGKARDFALAVECGANPPTISYAAFVTIMAEDASFLTPEEGMNIYSFTEFKTNMFLAARKTVDTVVVNTPESGDQLLLAMQKRGIDTTGVNTFGQAATALGVDPDTATISTVLENI